MSKPRFDSRITPARGDVAAAHLKGEVSAARFVEGIKRQVIAPVADLREHPAVNTRLETQLLFGEAFTIYETSDDWVWGQAELDSYVGYVRADALSGAVYAPTHRVRVLRTLVFPAPDIKSAPTRLLPLGAKLTVEDEHQRFFKIAHGGYVFAADVAPLRKYESDWVAIAEQFVGAPYLWGGKTLNGIDCSGVVQVSLESAGIAAPRDSDLQEQALGEALAPDAERQRGDLVFWKGHVGVMVDTTHLLHANAFHMHTEIEPLENAVARGQALNDPVSSIRRL
ncbi:MAG: NlpC/P60 family protein [Pseudomonadota bacterium]